MFCHLAALFRGSTAMVHRVAGVIGHFPAVLHGVTAMFRQFKSLHGRLTALRNHRTYLLSNKTSLLGHFALPFHRLAARQNAAVRLLISPFRNPNSEIRNSTFSLCPSLLPHPRMRFEFDFIEPRKIFRLQGRSAGAGFHLIASKDEVAGKQPQLSKASAP